LCRGRGTDDGGLDGRSQQGPRDGDREDRAPTSIFQGGGPAAGHLAGETSPTTLEENLARSDVANRHPRATAFALRPDGSLGRPQMAGASTSPAGARMVA